MPFFIHFGSGEIVHLIEKEGFDYSEINSKLIPFKSPSGDDALVNLEQVAMIQEISKERSDRFLEDQKRAIEERKKAGPGSGLVSFPDFLGAAHRRGH